MIQYDTHLIYAFIQSVLCFFYVVIEVWGWFCWSVNDVGLSSRGPQGRAMKLSNSWAVDCLWSLFLLAFSMSLAVKTFLDKPDWLLWTLLSWVNWFWSICSIACRIELLLDLALIPLNLVIRRILRKRGLRGVSASLVDIVPRTTGENCGMVVERFHWIVDNALCYSIALLYTSEAMPVSLCQIGHLPHQTA